MLSYVLVTLRDSNTILCTNSATHASLAKQDHHSKLSLNDDKQFNTMSCKYII